MEIHIVIYIFVSFFVGVVLCFIYFSLKTKLNFVSKSIYEALQKELEQIKNQFHQKEYEFNTHLTLKNLKIQELEKNKTEINIVNHKNQELQIEIGEKRIENQLLRTELSGKNIETTEKILKIDQLQEELQQIKSQHSELKAQNNHLSEKLASHKTEILDLQKTAHLQFEKIANELLEEKSNRFTEANTKNLTDLLKPLNENISLFKKKVEETYDKESKERFSLEEKVKELVTQTNKVSTEANNLANALKTQVKKQGIWGEMILESILQQSGLEKNREYYLQQSVLNDEGKTLRPDVIIKLPDHRVIIIDSKVSLTAYEHFCSTENAEQQKVYLNDHLRSIYSHIENLHSKNYDHLDDALDFTMMFIPIEPAYLIAVQSDPNLWTNAYKQRIMLISPTNLIACLKLMADLWKREYQSKNAMEIVKRGELLYEKFVGFVNTMDDLGKHIQKTQHAYQNAVSQLNTGSGNLIGHAIKLKNLGLKSSKEIPENMKPSALDMEDNTQNINLINPL